jgi:2-C-methyl-D-erythritol 2,4-cyclodiphosphate synthase
MTPPFRIGHGYDVHQLTENRPLILGGVTIPHPKGLLGHSDADVLTHAIIDALLGALALGNIGTFFPDTDPQYLNISSLILLDTVMEALTTHKMKIGNIDCVIAAQRPKLNPYTLQMRETLARHLHIDITAISIKPTTTEHLGFEGEEKGISAHAIVLLVSQ